MKSIARLISKRIVASKFTREDFLINVSYYIYKNMKYDGEHSTVSDDVL